MAFRRRSVKDVDLQAYRDFHAQQQKARQQAGDLPGEKFDWPDSTSILDDNTTTDSNNIYGNQSEQKVDEDLYGSSPQNNNADDDLYS